MIIYQCKKWFKQLKVTIHSYERAWSVLYTHTHCSLYEIGLDSFIRVQWNFFRILPNSEFNSSNYYRYCLRWYNSITNKLALDCSTVLRLCFKTRQNTICTQRWWTCNDTSTIDIQLGTICQLISETFAHHLIACLKVYALFWVVFTHKSKSFRLFSVKCKIAHLTDAVFQLYNQWIGEFEWNQEKIAISLQISPINSKNIRTIRSMNESRWNFHQFLLHFDGKFGRWFKIKKTA